MSTTARDRRHAIAFVGGSILLLVSFLAILGGVRFARHDRIYRVAVRESVAGLRIASTVEYKGVPIGAVRGIAFREGEVEVVEVELLVRQGVPIKVDTRARLRPQGITGLNGLELVGGTTAARDLPEGGVIPVEPSIMGELESAMRDVAAIARRLNAATAAIESEASGALADLRAALEAGRAAARGLEGTVAVIGTEAAASGAAFRAVADDLRVVLRDPAWRTLGGQASTAIEDLRRVAASLERAANEAGALAGENREDVRAAIQNLRHTTADLRAAARRIRESPASLVVEHPRAEKPIPDRDPASEEKRP